MFKLFAELIATHLEALERASSSEATLLGERETSELREQFIAVLGHDLRNPLASIAAGARMLPKAASIDAATEIVGLIEKSIARMSALIDDVLDFARGRLGSGVTVYRSPLSLQPALQQVISELRSSHPDRTINSALSLTEPVNCDGGRVAQLLSNLLANAITHGATSRPIQIRAVTLGGTFELSVANSGAPISAVAMAKLFQPFYRGAVRQSQQGLGLGLFIASEIARAHAGTLTVNSNDLETCFTFRMPLR